MVPPVGRFDGPKVGLPAGMSDGISNGLLDLGISNVTTGSCQIQRTSLFDCFAFQTDEIIVFEIDSVVLEIVQNDDLHQ